MELKEYFFTIRTILILKRFAITGCNRPIHWGIKIVLIALNFVKVVVDISKSCCGYNNFHKIFMGTQR